MGTAAKKPMATVRATYGAIAHASADIVGWPSRRSATVGPPSSPCTRVCGTPTEPLTRASSGGLVLRSDWGPQYAADAFRNELAWLGITHTPSFVGEPQCNGGIERFIRTLKE